MLLLTFELQKQCSAAAALGFSDLLFELFNAGDFLATSFEDDVTTGQALFGGDAIRRNLGR